MVGHRSTGLRECGPTESSAPEPCLKIYFKLIKNRFYLVEKLEIQVIEFMIMLTRSSERIVNPMRYTGVILS